MGLKLNDIASKGHMAAGVEKPCFKVQMIHYSMLEPSGNNFYAVDDVAELADDMLISGRILQNLIVRRVGISRYEVIAGHRRRLAAIMNVERGYKEFELLPCLVSGEDDITNEINLILTNSNQRIRTEYEKMLEVQRLKELLPLLEGDSLKGRKLRERIAEKLKLSKTKVAQLDNIANNLIPEAMDKFRAGELNVSTSNEIAGLEPEVQQELVGQNEKITLNAVKAVKAPEPKKKPVSESDTIELPKLEPSNNILLDSYSKGIFDDIKCGKQTYHIMCKSERYQHWREGDIITFEWCESQEKVKVQLKKIQLMHTILPGWAMIIGFKVIK